MAAYPLTAAQWDQLLGTTRGHDIVGVLEPFSGGVRLEPPVARVEERTAQALVGLGLEFCAGEIRPVSESAVRAAYAESPGRLRAVAPFALEGDLEFEFGRLRTSWEVLEHGTLITGNDGAPQSLVGEERWEAIGEALATSVFADGLPVAPEMAELLGPKFTASLRRNVVGLLTLHVALLAIAHDTTAARVAPLTALLAAGNWPWGFLDFNSTECRVLVYTG